MMQTLKEGMSELPDHRDARGRMYRLDSLLLLVIAGFMCGRELAGGGGAVCRRG